MLTILICCLVYTIHGPRYQKFTFEFDAKGGYICTTNSVVTPVASCEGFHQWHQYMVVKERFSLDTLRFHFFDKMGKYDKRVCLNVP